MIKSSFKNVILIAVTSNLSLAGITQAQDVDIPQQGPVIDVPVTDLPIIAPPVLVTPPIGADVPVFLPPNAVANVSANAETTQAIRFEIQSAQDFCRRVASPEYTVDCLGDALEKIAQDMPQTGDYAEAQVVIAQAASKLRKLARDNASSDLPTGVVQSTGSDGRRSNSALTPVRTDTLAQTNEAAAVILEEAETILLRSAANSDARRVHYEQIAEAVGSNKVLLRSL